MTEEGRNRCSWISLGHNRMADLSHMLQPMLHPIRTQSLAVFRLRCTTVGRPLAGATGCQRSITVRRQHNGTIGNLSVWNNRRKRLSSD